MAVKSRTVVVGTTATRLDTETGGSSSIWVQNDSDATVYLGGPDVATSGEAKGGALASGTQGVAFDLEADDALYGRVASGSKNVVVTETGV